MPEKEEELPKDIPYLEEITKLRPWMRRYGEPLPRELIREERLPPSKRAGHAGRLMQEALSRLTSEFRHSEKAIRKYRYAAKELQERCIIYYERLQRQELVVPSMYSYFQDFTEIAHRYLLHFVGPFQNLLMRIRHYLELSIDDQPASVREHYRELLELVQSYEKTAKKHQKTIMDMTIVINLIVWSGHNLRPAPEVQKYLRDALSSIIAFSNNAADSVNVFLSMAKSTIDKTERLIRSQETQQIDVQGAANRT